MAKCLNFYIIFCAMGRTLFKKQNWGFTSGFFCDILKMLRACESPLFVLSTQCEDIIANFDLLGKLVKAKPLTPLGRALLKKRGKTIDWCVVI